jgi:hypothetical protein
MIPGMMVTLAAAVHAQFRISRSRFRKSRVELDLWLERHRKDNPLEQA